MVNFQTILKSKRDYYGNTEAAIEFAVNEFTNQLQKELVVTEHLLNEQKRVIKEIPECKLHGWNCIPNAIEWIKEQKLNE